MFIVVAHVWLWTLCKAHLISCRSQPLYLVPFLDMHFAPSATPPLKRRPHLPPSFLFLELMPTTRHTYSCSRATGKGRASCLAVIRVGTTAKQPLWQTANPLLSRCLEHFIKTEGFVVQLLEFQPIKQFVKCKLPSVSF